MTELYLGNPSGGLHSIQTDFDWGISVTVSPKQKTAKTKSKKLFTDEDQHKKQPSEFIGCHENCTT